jgi:tetratricopeptide (TPR) repeat protein
LHSRASDSGSSAAVITAALDARRVGVHAPLSRDLLAAAAPAYLTSAQQATAPTDWVNQALAYATRQRRGAAATLSPVAAGMGTPTGYAVADYLHQHALRVRRTIQLPDSAWQALTDHHHPEDALSLADNARRRGHHPHAAETLYRRAADAGDKSAVCELGDLLVAQGRLVEAEALYREHADADDEPATDQLADLLALQGRLDEAIALSTASVRTPPTGSQSNGWPTCSSNRGASTRPSPCCTSTSTSGSFRSG